MTTAIIPVAGAGTRMLPMTSAIEKCMLPVVDGSRTRPVLDYMVEDCVGAGVKRIICVTSERGQQQISDYYSHEVPLTLRRYLERLGKQDALEAEQERRQKYDVTWEFVIQPVDLYGTAVPTYLSKDLLKGEKHFAQMGGDDFVYHADGTSELGLAIDAWKASGSDHTTMGLTIDRQEAFKAGLGIFKINQDGNFVDIEERLPLERIPEAPIGNISRYLFSDKIWEQIDEEMHEQRGTAEHYITYPIAAAVAAGQTFHVHPVTGVYLDCGNFDRLEASSRYVREHPRTA